MHFQAFELSAATAVMKAHSSISVHVRGHKPFHPKELGAAQNEKWRIARWTTRYFLVDDAHSIYRASRVYYSRLARSVGFGL